MISCTQTLSPGKERYDVFERIDNSSHLVIAHESVTDQLLFPVISIFSLLREGSCHSLERRYRTQSVTSYLLQMTCVGNSTIADICVYKAYHVLAMKDKEKIVRANVNCCDHD